MCVCVCGKQKHDGDALAVDARMNLPPEQKKLRHRGHDAPAVDIQIRDEKPLTSHTRDRSSARDNHDATGTRGTSGRKEETYTGKEEEEEEEKRSDEEEDGAAAATDAWAATQDKIFAITYVAIFTALEVLLDAWIFSRFLPSLSLAHASLVVVLIMSTFGLYVPYASGMELWSRKHARMASLVWKHGTWSDLVWFIVTVRYWAINAILAAIELSFARPRPKRIIFILGHPRSGTTYVHQNVLRATGASGMAYYRILGPSSTVSFMAEHRCGFGGRLVDRWRTASNSLFNGFHSLQDYEEDDLILTLGFHTHTLNGHDGGGLGWKWSPGLRCAWWQNARFFMRTTPADLMPLRRIIDASHAKVWVGKPITQTQNFEVLRKVFPEALWIHCVRDVRSTMLSTVGMYRYLHSDTHPMRVADIFDSEHVMRLRIQEAFRLHVPLADTTIPRLRAWLAQRGIVLDNSPWVRTESSSRARYTQAEEDAVDEWIARHIVAPSPARDSVSDDTSTDSDFDDIGGEDDK